MHSTAMARLAAAVALTATSSACTVTTQIAQRVSLSSATFVEVTNWSWSDVAVYAVGSGPRWRLGMVTSQDTRTFLIPSQSLAASDLRLMADPIGSREIFVSDRISVSPGQRVDLTVTPRLAQSYYALRW